MKILFIELTFIAVSLFFVWAVYMLICEAHVRPDMKVYNYPAAIILIAMSLGIFFILGTT